MGSTSGRRPVRLRKKRRTSTRIASRSRPGSVRSSRESSSMNAASICDASLTSGSLAASATTPRVTISGDPTSPPSCARMATTGSTMPSPARCRRSLMTSSATSPTRVSSIRTRPVGALRDDGGRRPCRTASRRRSRATSTSIGCFAPRVTRSATRRWCASWRNSPCTGTKKRGCTSDSTSFRSSSLPWPETCTCRVASVMTSRAAAGHVIR